MPGNDLEMENPAGLDFTPPESTKKISASSSKRVALFIFMAAVAIFALVTFAIMGSEQIVRGSKAPDKIVKPSSSASQIIPSIEFRQPDPEPEPEEDLTRSQALEEADKNLPSAPTTTPTLTLQQLQELQRLRQLQLQQMQQASQRSAVPAYGRNRRRPLPFISNVRRNAHAQRMQAASAQTSVSASGSSQNSQSPLPGVDALDASLPDGPAMSGGMNMSESSGASDSSAFAGDVTAMSDPNGWSRKDAFANHNPTAGNEYSKHNVMFQKSSFELKAGTIIPCVLISGLNSDLPGNAIGQVSENVWDTATGNYLLIPRGSRLVGTYDNQVTYGQNRALVVWSRLIFPDGTSLTLDNLKGADQSGFSGFKDQVNKHWGSLITSALLVSLIGAGVELANPNRNNNNNNNNNNSRTVGDILSQRVATSIGEALTQIIQREIHRQPTIKVRPGYRFMVMVQKDIVFPGSWQR